MPLTQVDLDKETDETIQTVVHINRITKKGPTSKAEVIAKIVREWHEYHGYAVQETISGLSGD